ncbi:Histone H2A [Pseudolycoriella hygida]|uniref:Histone H2A n=1 Tax=Pseudolycoriella hygida TaxID=35572 RepID=A0A9Q0S217_9DIPT|nr:Histone H2A [Pseudolycoriella hygida]
MFSYKMPGAAKRLSKTKRAGITMSVARIEKKLREGGYGKRVSPCASVFMATTLEYLCAEILDLAGTEAARVKNKLIHPRQVMLAIENDAELDILLRNVIIPGTGVRSQIHPLLLEEKKSSRKNQIA